MWKNILLIQKENMKEKTTKKKENKATIGWIEHKMLDSNQSYNNHIKYKKSIYSS